MAVRNLFALFILSGIILQSYGWNNGLALTPTMGWNSYYHFGENISETLIKRIADAMDTNGMKAAGYDYIALDDAWMAAARDGSGNLVADPVKFPSGMKALGDYLHNKGFKLGIYEDRGTSTCYGLPGSYNHETADANLFASWGVDFVKIDNCAAVGDLQTVYTTWHNAIAACGRPMIYNMCCWGFPGAWVTANAHSWRMSGDMWDGWDRVLTIVDMNAGLSAYAGPGHWNDPDILQVGRGGMTWDQYRAHFSLWAIMAAPLIAAGDMGLLSAEAKSILQNAEVIAVDQDSLGLQGTRVRVDGKQEVWSKALKDGTRAVVLFNRDITPAVISVSWSEIGLTGDTALVRDLWAHAVKGAFYKTYATAVPATGVVMLKVARAAGGTVDRQAPVTPVIVSAALLPPGNRARLSWTLSTDNIGVVGYRIYRNGVQAGTTPDTAIALEALAWNTSFLFSVRAQDAAGNLSDSLNFRSITTDPSPSDFVYLSDLTWASATTGWGTVQKDKSVAGAAIILRTATYAKGLGTHAVSQIVYALNKAYKQFYSDIGVDDETDGSGSVTFTVYADGVKKFDSPVIAGWTAVQSVGVDVTGVDTLKLVVGNGGNTIDSDHADWADAKLIRSALGTDAESEWLASPASSGLNLKGANPFTHTIALRYHLSKSSGIRLGVYALSGQLVRRLAAGRVDPGVYECGWDGRDGTGKILPANIYLVRFEADGFSKTIKAMLVR